MHPLFSAVSSVVRRLSIIAAIFASLVYGHAQKIDLNGNGMSDVWEWVYNAYGVSPTADPDGDGFNNLQESMAGTDPYDSNSFPHISFGAYAGTNFSVTLPCALGKQYTLQSITVFSRSNWVVETNIVARSGTNVTLSAPMVAVQKFYRIAISDVDTAGSGMNDWEKYELGLDPSNAWSNGQQDLNGNAMSDYEYATNLLAQQNVISITASDATASEPDPGQTATATGQFTVTRGGFPLDTITVNLSSGTSGAGMATPKLDYGALPPTVTLAAGVSSQTITVTPLANTNLQAPVVVQLQVLPGANYTVANPNTASVVIYPSPTLTGNGLLGQYYTNSSQTYTNSQNFNPTNLFLTRVDPVIDFNWTNGQLPDLSNGLYTVRWTGQIEPQLSDTYFFAVASDDGCKLWVNDQLLINKWQAQGLTTWTNAIALQGGVRYDIKLEYLQAGGAGQTHLYWYSADQAQEIIPTSDLYSTNTFVSGVTNAASQVTSSLTAVAFLGQPFAFTVTGANTPIGFTASNLPPGLTFNTTNGVISGVPALVGTFDVTLTASNNIGVGGSVLVLTVLNTGSSVVQEIWTNIPGTNVADIPTSTPASLTNTLGTLEGITDYGDNYGERIRGYFTAPTTGNYYFWIAGSDSAQLWISDDSDPVNKVLRCSVLPTNNPSAPPQNGTGSRQWLVQPGQQSPWLALVAGQKYYIEILHKAGVGPGDNWSVGWLQDSTGTNFAPGGVVPGYLLSRYYPPLPVNIPGTLYTANMLALPGATSDGVGSATLRVNAAGTQATLNFQMSNLAGTPTGQAIDSDPYLADPGELIFDISAAKQQSDGSYLWNIQGTGPLQVADILEIIAEGKASIVIQSTAFPNGEIGGHFTLADGTQNFVAPPAPPAWTDDSANANAASRFLAQATFGASSNDIAVVQSTGYTNWINNQFALPVSYHLPVVETNANPDPTDPYQSYLTFNTWWQQSVTAPDQLRQRVAFALSEIFVISENGALENHADGLSGYYDTLLKDAFGNFRQLLEDVTLHPSMGQYLSMLDNNAGSIVTGLHADENYAREIQQLFSIGLNREWPDGTLILNAQDNLVPTYNQNVVMGFASVFTGWNYYQTNQANGRLPNNWYPAANYTNPMVLVPSHHEIGSKQLLDNIVLPPAWGSQAVPSTTNDAYCSQDLEQALNTIFNNQNVAPFICRELIQRLVTSNPSRDYVYRVAQVFNDDGTGVRGNLQAVVKAILLDYEARSPDLISQPDYGKQREPLVRVTSLARAFPAPAPISGTYSQTTNQLITVTTSVPHHLNSGDTVFLTFADTSGNAAPATQGYGVSVTSPTTFTVNAPQLSTGSYGQTNGVITVSIGGNGLAVGNPVYLAFTTGGASSGLFHVASVIDTAHFTVATTDLVQRTGAVLLPKISTGGLTQTGTNVVFSTSGPHGLKVGNSVYIDFSYNPFTNGTYTVAAVEDATHFMITVTNKGNQVQDGVTIYALVPPPLVRSGMVTVQWNTWNLGYTDTGGSTSLMESPLRSPTVFNFYYPGYEFPGALASAGLTTPEFQLTTASGVSAQMNFIEGGVLGNTGNTNGLSSFSSGNGSIVLNLGPWMTPAYTANAGVASMVGSLSSLLAAGQISPTVQSTIVSYITNNFAYSTPPTATQMRDRVRAAVHMIASSPEYMIQK